MIFVIFLSTLVLFFPLFLKESDNYKCKDLYGYVETSSLDYWRNKRNYSTATIAGVEEIERINAAIDSKMIEFYRNKGVSRELATYNLLNYEIYLAKETIVNMIKAVADKFFQHIPDENYYNFDSLAEKNEISYAIVTEKSDIKTIPIDLCAFCDKNMDEMQITTVRFGEPLIVLHRTVDNGWSFVRTYNNVMGWLESKNIAIADRDEFTNYINMNDFLIVISKNELIGNSYLDMGTKLALKNEKKESYIIKFPIRDRKNGLIHYRDVEIKKNPGLHRGYLTYSEKNIVEQAMKYHGTLYAWGSANNGIDCSGLVMNVYSVFGLRLPRNSQEQQALAKNLEFFSGSDSGSGSGSRSMYFGKGQTMKVNRALDSAKIGSILFFPGHAMLYLGKVANRHYVIHSIFACKKNNGHGKYEKYYPRQVMISALENLKKFSGVSFIDSLVSIATIE
jgi:hypothetical protein